MSGFSPNPSVSRINTVLAILVAVLIVVVAGLLMLPLSGGSVTIRATPVPSLAVPATITAQPATRTMDVPPSPTATAMATLTPLPAAELPGVATVPSLTDPVSPERVLVREEHLPDGMYLIVSGGVLPQTYRLGPLAQGTYAVGPNDTFLVYVSSEGRVFALRFGQDHFVRIANLKRILGAAAKGVEPQYRLDFSDRGFVTFLVLYEDVFGQKIPVALPREITY